MNVLALTILISICLAGIFIVCFMAELKRGKRRGIEHVSLLPLDDDDTAITTKTSPSLPKTLPKTPSQPNKK